MGDNGAKALVTNLNLKFLDESSNHITSIGAIELLKHPKLENLDLSYNEISEDVFLLYDSFPIETRAKVNFLKTISLYQPM